MCVPYLEDGRNRGVKDQLRPDRYFRAVDRFLRSRPHSYLPMLLHACPRGSVAATAKKGSKRLARRNACPHARL